MLILFHHLLNTNILVNILTIFFKTICTGKNFYVNEISLANAETKMS